MSDRESPAIFGAMFEMLARNPTDEHKAMAHELWPLTLDYDFCSGDDALVVLGLAGPGQDPDYPGDGTVMLYGPEGKRRPR